VVSSKDALGVEVEGFFKYYKVKAIRPADFTDHYVVGKPFINLIYLGSLFSTWIATEG